MRFDLTSGAGGRFHGVFDPAAMLHVINDPELRDLDDDALGEDGAKGNILLLQWSHREAVTFRVFVDEEPDERLRERATDVVEDSLLNVPSGTLVAAGTGCLCRPGEERVTAEEFEAIAEDWGSTAHIPPGDYVVDAYLMPEEKEEEATPAAPPAAGLPVVCCLGLLASILGTVAVAVTVVVGLVLGRDFFRLLGYWVAGLVAFWALVLTADRYLRRRAQARRDAEREEPPQAPLPFDAAIVLTPMTPDRMIGLLARHAANELPEESPARGVLDALDKVSRPSRRRRRRPRR